MLREITLPGISENVESGEVIAILVSVGDVVEEDQSVVELETEKAAFEVPSPNKGRITEITVKEGQTVRVGEVLARLDTDIEAAAAKEPEPRPVAGEENEAGDQGQKAPSPPRMTQPTEEAQPPGPAVEGRRQPRPAAEAQRSARTQEEGPKPAVPVAAAPSIRQLARELGIDINEVSGSGPGGRITQDDVKQYARRLVNGMPAPAQVPDGTRTEEVIRPLPDLSQWGDVERQPMSKTRRTIADTMGYGWRHIPHVTQYDRADITDLETFRKAHAAEVEKRGGKLSVTSIVVKIVASALRVFPQFNAGLDTERDEIVYRKYCHIAVAVDTDRGLLVPVIRDVDKKSLRDVSVELAQLAQKSRDKQIMPDELMGGGFTVSNLGGLGGTNFAPIVYWPQVAILGISRAIWEAVPHDGEIRERLILPLSLSYDHRVIDGADGARFLHWVARALEQPLLAIL